MQIRVDQDVRDDIVKLQGAIGSACAKRYSLGAIIWFLLPKNNFELDAFISRVKDLIKKEETSRGSSGK